MRASTRWRMARSTPSVIHQAFICRSRKEAEAALEAERRAKEELSARQIKDAEAAAKMLRRMLDEQRSQLEGERHVIQKELLKEIDELRAKLKLAQARPPPVAVPAVSTASSS